MYQLINDVQLTGIVKSRYHRAQCIKKASFIDNQGSQEFPNGEPVPGKSHEIEIEIDLLGDGWSYATWYLQW